MTLPNELWQIRDKVIENTVLDKEPPADIELIYEWLSVEGWDDLLGDLDNWAINLNYLAQLEFNDESLKYHLEDFYDKVNVDITDEVRLSYAKELIQNESGDNGRVVSVNSYKLEREDEKLSYIGCYIEMQGQGGPAAQWCGTFKSKEEFTNFIKKSGFLFTDEIELISDDEILNLWNKK